MSSRQRATGRFLARVAQALVVCSLLGLVALSALPHLQCVQAGGRLTFHSDPWRRWPDVRCEESQPMHWKETDEPHT